VILSIAIEYGFSTVVLEQSLRGHGAGFGAAVSIWIPKCTSHTGSRLSGSVVWRFLRMDKVVCYYRGRPWKSIPSARYLSYYWRRAAFSNATWPVSTE